MRVNIVYTHLPIRVEKISQTYCFITSVRDMPDHVAIVGIYSTESASSKAFILANRVQLLSKSVHMDLSEGDQECI